ncbi:MAG: YceH family protein [Terriglobia bacterium]
MDILLNETEVRVLGALVEKEITTPDYYPLSLNALVNACNQKSNRHPVMNLDEDAVRDALTSLNEKGLAGAASGADSRVTKYEHRLQEVFNFTRPEIAVLCVLMLRGPQTPGELRGRGERLHRFDDLEAVHSALQHLISRQPPLAKILPRQPGTKEARYAHLLAGDSEAWIPEAPTEAATGYASPDSERLTRLENQVASLQQEITDLKHQLAEFRKPSE